MKKLLLFLVSIFSFLFLFPIQSFADTILVSNPRLIGNDFNVDLQISGTPDNICSWWTSLHHVYIIDLNDNIMHDFAGCALVSSNGDGSVNYTFSGAPQPPTGTYKLEIVESEQNNYDVTTSNTFDWVATVNFPPSVQAPANAVFTPGQTYTGSGSFIDQDSTSWTATVDYGDGTGIQPLTLSGMNYSLNHTYNQNGSYSPIVTVIDEHGGNGTATARISVEDYDLTVSNPRLDANGEFAIDINVSAPDNVCSWWTALHHAYILDASKEQVIQDFAGCTSNGGNNYTINGVGVLQAGTYKIKVLESEQPGLNGGNYEVISMNSFNWIIPPVTLVLTSTADTYVRSGQANHNQGGSLFMRIQPSGDNRSLVRFDQSAIQSEVGNGEVLSAKLRVTIVDNGNNWGTGRTVDIHRLISDWAEGNGTENDRGTGSGATWNCAIDSLIENQAKNCTGITEWEMGQPNNPAVHPWIASPTDSETIINNQSGVVEYDVTTDVQSFMNGTNTNYGWIIKKTNEGQNGQVSFGTKESSSVPQLIVTYQP